MAKAPEKPKAPLMRCIYECDDGISKRTTCSKCHSSLYKVFGGILGAFFDTRDTKCVNPKCENYYGGENGRKRS